MSQTFNNGVVIPLDYDNMPDTDKQVYDQMKADGHDVVYDNGNFYHTDGSLALWGSAFWLKVFNYIYLLGKESEGEANG